MHYYHDDYGTSILGAGRSGWLLWCVRRRRRRLVRRFQRSQTIRYNDNSTISISVQCNRKISTLYKTVHNLRRLILFFKFYCRNYSTVNRLQTRLSWLQKPPTRGSDKIVVTEAVVSVLR